MGENKLIQLDLRGGRITGVLADKYVLSKTDAGITEKYWKLTEIKGKRVVWDQVNTREPHIILKAEGKRLHGNGGCSGLTGSYELKELNEIRFSQIVSTRMACPEMEIETQMEANQ